MENSNNLVLKNYLSNIQVNLIVAAYTHVPKVWRELDYIPNYNKFYFICSGEGLLKIGNKEFYPKPGQLFLMPAGVKQSYSTVNDNTFTKYWCHFTASIGDINLFDILKFPSFIDVPNAELLRGLFEDLILNYKSDKLTASINVKVSLLKLISYYIENSILERVNLTCYSSVNKLNFILDYIEKNLKENINLEELSKLMHIHPNYFIKLFKSNFGLTPIQYINKLRLEKAKHLLEITDLSITEIGNSVGFNDLFYFSKAFKNFTGFSPSEFRNMSKAYK